MTQQAPAQQNAREEERVLGISYDRAVRAMPALVKKALGAEVNELGDGYWVAAFGDDVKHELTVRLGKQAADTRFMVRAETTSQGAAFITFLIIFSIITMGLGLLPLLPMLMKRQREAQRNRDLLVHKMFRAIEDAVADQGASPNYRVAAGEGAPEPVEEPEAPADEKLRRTME